MTQDRAREPDGRILVRVPKYLHARIKEAARVQGVSMNMFIATCLAEGTPRKESAKAMPVSMDCSFCGKSNEEVQRMIAGNTGLICNECMRLCADIMEDGVRITEAEARSLWAALQSLAKHEREDELGAITKNNAGQLSDAQIGDLVAKFRFIGSPTGS